MIAFATAITKPEVYDSCAGPGIELAAEPDSVVIANAASGSIFRNYNAIMDEAELEDLEVLVLLHQDAEIVDPQFIPKLRAAMTDPRSASSAASARSACAASPGGRAR